MKNKKKPKKELRENKGTKKKPKQKMGTKATISKRKYTNEKNRK